MLALLVLAGATLSACTPAPEPSPTPTAAFASEEEAFAAAEEVYRAYIEASNAVDFQDPSTFEPLAEFTAGDYFSDEREQLSEMNARGYIRGGEIKIVEFRPTSAELSGIVTARVCSDVSGTTFTDANGEDLVPPDRPNRSALDLTFESIDDALFLTAAKPVDDDSCASD